jgi:hypothetical protein
MRKKGRRIAANGGMCYPTLGRLTQGDCEFERGLGYIGTPYLQKQLKKRGEERRGKKRKKERKLQDPH